MSRHIIDCTLVILSFNTRDTTEKCLRAAERAKKLCEKMLKNKVEILVLDNGSADGSAAMIKKKFPNCILIQEPQNLGYAKGNNILMRQVKTPYMLLLNSDAYLEEDTLVKGLQYVTKHTNVDGLVCKLTYEDGTPQSSGGYFPTPYKTFLWVSGLSSLPVLKNIFRPVYQHDVKFYGQDRQMEWVSGAFFLIKSEIFAETQGFDERFFLYMEDVEWQFRIKRAGYKVYFTPTIQIIHSAGKSTGGVGSTEALQRNVEGMKRFHEIHFPKTMALISTCLRAGLYLRAGIFGLTGDKKRSATYLQVARVRAN
jgi:N-acetylglucosaminyl-diphospho-decaprenol L-rhamnosyltransferase